METSNRGGYRDNSGRKPIWKSGTTKAVKLPEALIPRLLEIAKILDQGGEVLVIDSDPNEPTTPDRLSWNVYERVKAKGEQWKWVGSHTTEYAADSQIVTRREHNHRMNSMNDYGIICLEWEKRLERISPVPQPKPDDAVLGGQ